MISLNKISDITKACIFDYVRSVNRFCDITNSVLLCVFTKSILRYHKFKLVISHNHAYQTKEPASVAQLDAPPDWRPGGRGFNSRRGRQHSFVEIDHEIFSTVILSLLLIQEGQLSVSSERMCTILVNRLDD